MTEDKLRTELEALMVELQQSPGDDYHRALTVKAAGAIQSLLIRMERLTEALVSEETKCSLGIAIADDGRTWCGFGNPAIDRCCRIRKALSQ